MKPVDRYEFIEKWLRDRSRTIPHSVDCLDQDFVDAYIDHTNASFQPVTLGAHRCNLLSRDLADMVRLGRLKRWRSGVHGGLSGFPKWVWSYHLTDDKK